MIKPLAWLVFIGTAVTLVFYFVWLDKATPTIGECGRAPNGYEIPCD